MELYLAKEQEQVDLATVLDQMNAALCVYKGENKMNVYNHEGAFS